MKLAPSLLLFCVAGLAGCAHTPTVSSSAPSGVASPGCHPIDLTPYVNDSIQRSLYPTFPTGQTTPPKNDFGVPFYILPAVNNFVQIDTTTDNNPLTVNVGVSGVKRVYTLMQAYAAVSGREVCSVEFIGSGGAHQTFSLVNGVNIRDFFEAVFARTINNTTTRPAYQFIGKGGAFTGHTISGPSGYYNFDEQEFVLDPAFRSQTLVSIKFTAQNGAGSPLLLGLTVKN